MTVPTYQINLGTGKMSENGQNSQIVDKTVGYDTGKLVSGVANDWVTRRHPKSFGYGCLMYSLSIVNLLVSDTLCDRLMFEKNIPGSIEGIEICRMKW